MERTARISQQAHRPNAAPCVRLDPETARTAAIIKAELVRRNNWARRAPELRATLNDSANATGFPAPPFFSWDQAAAITNAKAGEVLGFPAPPLFSWDRGR